MARPHDEEFTAFAAVALPHLRRTAYLMSGDWHRAEDVAQEALIRVYRAWRRVERHEGLLALLGQRLPPTRRRDDLVPGAGAGRRRVPGA